MILGWDAPLAPARTGVADYAQRLLETLRRHGEVCLPGAGRQADLWIYHLGNNQLHRPIYERALSVPGVAVLHDAVLLHFFLGCLDEAAFVAEFIDNYGLWYEEHARQLFRGRARSAADPEYFRYPMLSRIGRLSQAVIVHNAAAARMVREHAPTALVHQIPHVYAPDAPAKALDLKNWRDRHGIQPSTYTFGLFGHLRESKRVLPALRAFASLAGVDARLVVAGEFGSVSLERAAEPWLRLPGVVRLGYTQTREFSLLLEAVDAGISLRYPSCGETSGITVRLMGLGKPVIVTTGEETKDWPSAIAFPIDAGPSEEAMLREAMLWMIRNPGEGRAVGRRAAWHIEHQHSVDRVTRLYLEAAREASEKMPALP